MPSEKFLWQITISGPAGVYTYCRWAYSKTQARLLAGDAYRKKTKRNSRLVVTATRMLFFVRASSNGVMHMETIFATSPEEAKIRAALRINEREDPEHVSFSPIAPGALVLPVTNSNQHNISRGLA